MTTSWLHPRKVQPITFGVDFPASSVVYSVAYKPYLSTNFNIKIMNMHVTNTATYPVRVHLNTFSGYDRRILLQPGDSAQLINAQSPLLLVEYNAVARLFVSRIDGGTTDYANNVIHCVTNALMIWK
jgi:hypothetical protein